MLKSRPFEKNKLPQLSDEEIVEAIGKVYDVNARFHKGVQHLQEQNKWKYDDLAKNMSSLVHELDLDLLKEAEDEIKTMLFIRFFPKISQAARIHLNDFLKNLNLQITFVLHHKNGQCKLKTNRRSQST